MGYSLGMKYQQGFSLLEVIIAMMILIIMAVGATGYQLFATQKTIEAHYHTQALWIAKQALDQLSVSNVLQTQYLDNTTPFSLTGTASCPTNCQAASSGCTGAILKTYFENNLDCLVSHQPNNALIPGGTILITCAAQSGTTGSLAVSRECSVQVDWDIPMMKYRNNNNLSLGADKGRVELKSWTAL
jgi:prepilin-type N-terminal cleavage/methylation domain-containing protein